jgi:hypothetical protein
MKLGQALALVVLVRLLDWCMRHLEYSAYARNTLIPRMGICIDRMLVRP